MMYEIKNNEILHYGLGHDDNPPGRGSGRYAYGSGEDPKQDKKKYYADEKAANEAKRNRAKAVKAAESGNAREVNKYKEYLSEAELQKAIKRLNTEKTLRSLETPKFEVLNSMLKTIGAITTASITIKNANNILHEYIDWINKPGDVFEKGKIGLK